VQAIKRQLVEYSYRSLQELPSQAIIQLLESSVIEIQRIQRELDIANAEIKILKSSETPTPKKDGEQ
jgi:hypothetical protein